MTDLKITGTVLFRIRKEKKRWLRLPEWSIDPKMFHYAPNAIKEASVSLIPYRVRCTRTDKSLHTTSCPSQSDYLSEVTTYVKDPLLEGTAERLLQLRRILASIDILRHPNAQGQAHMASPCLYVSLPAAARNSLASEGFARPTVFEGLNQ